MKNIILLVIAFVISVAGADKLTPLIFGDVPMQSEEATAVAILIFAVLWFIYQAVRMYSWQYISVALSKPIRRTEKFKSAEIDMLDMKYRVLHQEMLERRGETC